MPQIITRTEWGAAPARSIERVPWAARTGIMIHYSAATASQSVRDIQRYHMETRGWSDIGYNMLIRSTTGTIYEGRGLDVLGAHCKGYNTPNIGICVIGSDDPGRQDVSDTARESLRWLVAYIRRRAGRPLPILGHRDRGSTQCPGDELYAWAVKQGMPGTTPAPPRPAPTGWEERIMARFPTLRQGDTGRHVKQSQGLLAAAGYPPRASFRPNGEPDGIAGDGWGDAVEAFQRARKITADRVIGPVTWGELTA